MQYETKHKKIEAVKFEYSKQGIEDLRLFLGEYLGNVTKARCPDAVGKAQLLKNTDGHLHFYRTLHEGEYVVKESKESFRVCKSDEFESLYKIDDDEGFMDMIDRVL